MALSIDDAIARLQRLRREDGGAGARVIIEVLPAERHVLSPPRLGGAGRGTDQRATGRGDGAFVSDDEEEPRRVSPQRHQGGRFEGASPPQVTVSSKPRTRPRPRRAASTPRPPPPSAAAGRGVLRSPGSTAARRGGGLAARLLHRPSRRHPAAPLNCRSSARSRVVPAASARLIIVGARVAHPEDEAVGHRRGRGGRGVPPPAAPPARAAPRGPCRPAADAAGRARR